MPVQFTKSVKARINLSASEWELYSSMPGVDDAARKLNKAAEYAIANSTNSRDAMQLIYPMLRELRAFGAIDSEPIWVASNLCERAFRDADE